MQLPTRILWACFLVSSTLFFCACPLPPETPEDEDTTISDLASNEVLYYNSNKTGTWEIWKLEEGAEVQLTNDANFDFWWARVSPDGTKFLCYRSPVGDEKEDNDYSRAELWVFDINGNNGEKIIDLNEYDWRAQGVADWSPDGTRLVMAAESREPNNNNNYFWNIFITDANGNNAVEASQRASYFADPSWSPDGTQITYVALPEDFTGIDLLLVNSEVYIADIDANWKMVNEQRLTFDNIKDNDPYFSPDGTKVAFESWTDPTITLNQFIGIVALRMVDLNTNPPATLMLYDDGNINTVPSWTTDSESVYFHRLQYAPLQGWHIAKVDINGSNFSVTLQNNNYGFINPHLVYW